MTYESIYIILIIFRSFISNTLLTVINHFMYVHCFLSLTPDRYCLFTSVIFFIVTFIYWWSSWAAKCQDDSMWLNVTQARTRWLQHVQVLDTDSRREVVSNGCHLWCVRSVNLWTSHFTRYYISGLPKLQRTFGVCCENIDVPLWPLIDVPLSTHSLTYPSPLTAPNPLGK